MAHRWPIIVIVIAGCSRAADPPVAPSTPPLVIPVGGLPVDLAAGDLDGDGAMDLVSADARDRAISVRLRRGGSWVAADSIATGFEPHMLALTDLDGDRDLDVVATSHDSGAVFVALNDGAGRFTPAAGSPVTAFAVARPHNHGLAVGDVNGDGHADVIVTDQNQRAFAVLLGDGGGGLALAGPPIALGAEAYPPALGDLDGDGRLDAVVPLLSSDAIGAAARRDVTVLRAPRRACGGSGRSRPRSGRT